jgi:hypothetical protein
MGACITCSQIFAEIFSGVLAFGISTKGWNGEDMRLLKWTAKIEASIRIKPYNFGKSKGPSASEIFTCSSPTVCHILRFRLDKFGVYILWLKYPKMHIMKTNSHQMHQSNAIYLQSVLVEGSSVHKSHQSPCQPV